MTLEGTLGAALRLSASVEAFAALGAELRLRQARLAGDPHTRELLRDVVRAIVAANGWIEGTTVGSIILGTVLGGALISPHIASHIIKHTPPAIHTPASSDATAWRTSATARQNAGPRTNAAVC